MTILKAREIIRGKHWRLRFKFRLSDFWIGIRWQELRDYELTGLSGPGERTNFDLWLCLLPCCVLHLEVWWPHS